MPKKIIIQGLLSDLSCENAQIADISGRTNSRIKGENAFVYGLGFRPNKHFRISCGALLFRSAGTDSKLRHEFYVGPAIDITGLAWFRTQAGRGRPARSRGTAPQE